MTALEFAESELQLLLISGLQVRVLPGSPLTAKHLIPPAVPPKKASPVTFPGSPSRGMAWCLERAPGDQESIRTRAAPVPRTGNEVSMLLQPRGGSFRGRIGFLVVPTSRSFCPVGNAPRSTGALCFIACPAEQIEHAIKGTQPWKTEGRSAQK